MDKHGKMLIILAVLALLCGKPANIMAQGQVAEQTEEQTEQESDAFTAACDHGGGSGISAFYRAWIHLGRELE